ncbi:type II toxin-antitoxin system RelB/DinJ family antitoxin [Yersinia pseudotuberculosis]|uniref:type II toxin-antitoxin system RelB/DinJ family antitoxin n=1 Tax=Yersinia pseudotuberculosis TaxID=633 RepID=UPI0020008AEA|nr:type II toxin-antitoxin system RelB/DinJ family antitoxin [Yersinia pseudotuberculosis]
MEARIQFRIGEDTKRLAQQSADRRGVTLSDACRSFAEGLAEEQRKVEEQNQWLKKEVNAAFEKLDSGNASFMNQNEAKVLMEKRKAEIRAKAGR